MSLFLISSPIGNIEDITVRALKKLNECPILIAEEPKILRRRLSAWSINPREKEIHSLNEHSSREDIKALCKLCKENENVAFLSDCGTPSFFDPGFQLVEECRTQEVGVFSLPGVSSLTALMPYLKRKTESFDILGFPPQKKEERVRFFKELKHKQTRPFLLLDTPYRLQKVIDELLDSLPESHCVFGINLTCENEIIFYGKPAKIKKDCKTFKKENFVCMVYI